MFRNKSSKTFYRMDTSILPLTMEWKRQAFLRLAVIQNYRPPEVAQALLNLLMRAVHLMLTLRYPYPGNYSSIPRSYH